jgi:hypothetical protein
VTLRRAAADPALGILRLPASFSQTAWPSFRAEIASAPVAPPHSASRALKKPGGNPSSLTDRGERRPRSATSQGKPSRRALQRRPGNARTTLARSSTQPRALAYRCRAPSPRFAVPPLSVAMQVAPLGQPIRPAQTPSLTCQVRDPARRLAAYPSPPSRWGPGAPPPHRE